MIKVLDHGFVKLVDHMGSDAAIVQAARVSYGDGTKTPSDDRTLIRYLMRHGHTTPFEMVQFKFHVKLPIFVCRQWHRHRTWSYNEVSARYSELPDETYQPDKWRLQSIENRQGSTPGTHLSMSGQHSHQSRIEYEDLLGRDIAREMARIVLPVAQYTEMYAGVDLHNLMAFLRQRMDSHAQEEIRVYAAAMFDLVAPIVPEAMLAFHDYVLEGMRLTRFEVEALKENRPLPVCCSNREHDEFQRKRSKMGLKPFPRIGSVVYRDDLEALGVRHIVSRNGHEQAIGSMAYGVRLQLHEGIKLFTRGGRELIRRK